VLTPGVAWAANRDDRLLADVPCHVEIIRTRSLEPRPGPRSRSGPFISQPPEPEGAPRLRLLRRLKSHAAHARRFPDINVGWTPFAVAAGLRTIRQAQPRLLYSTAGPFTSHLVALLLHRLTGLPRVAELRDGWYEWNRAIFPDYPFWRHWLERPLESAVIHRAERVVLVTDLMTRAFRCHYRDLPAEHFVHVPNGYDRVQFAGLPPPRREKDRFEVVHAGSLYYGRSLEAFLEAAGRLGAEDASFAASFHLTLLGSLDEGARVELAQQLERHGLFGSVSHQGYVDHRSALVAMSSADLLLLVVNTTPGAEAAVPGKLYEYLAVGRPILAIVPAGAEASQIVRRTRSGWVAPAHDPDGILPHLRAAFAAHLAGSPLAPDPTEVARYDRRVLASDLARVFDDVLAARTIALRAG
jgi:glycosyltransferase involved in cell wall biosynthesis